ncbi:MAG: glutaredoxin family protein [Acidimicrobiales bacterium]
MASRSTKAQWTNTALFAGTAVAWFALNRGDGGLDSLIVPAMLGGIALASSPLLKRTSVSHDEAQATDRDVVIYHRPGCSFCIRMKAMLGTVGRKAVWVDIWDDDEAAAFVRSLNEGNETVPTVMIDGKPHTNPAPSLVREALVS